MSKKTKKERKEARAHWREVRYHQRFDVAEQAALVGLQVCPTPREVVFRSLYNGFVFTWLRKEKKWTNRRGLLGCAETAGEALSQWKAAMGK